MRTLLLYWWHKEPLTCLLCERRYPVMASHVSSLNALLWGLRSVQL